MGKKKVEYPEYIYVVREDNEDGSHFYAAHETPVDAAEKGETIEYGVYKLAAVNDVTLRPNIRTVK